jgi:hypothetical protein
VITVQTHEKCGVVDLPDFLFSGLGAEALGNGNVKREAV